jgi:hypothetical protein
MKQTGEGFPDVESIIQSTDTLSPATMRRLTEILTKTVKKVQLRIELAVVIYVPFVKATYNHEGDGPLAITT